MKNNQIGRSMIEMLGVLAVIGVLSAMGLAGYSKAMTKHKMNRTVNQMAQIVNNVRTAFITYPAAEYPYDIFGAQKDDATTVSGMQKAVALHIFPDEMIVDKTIPVIQNVYKGDVYIISEDQGKSFDVIFEGLPKEVSIAIGTMDWGMSDVSGLQEVLINDDNVEETTTPPLE